MAISIKSPPSMIQPILSTVLSIIGLIGCFYMVLARLYSLAYAGLSKTLFNPPSWTYHTQVLGEALFIAIAVYQWVIYFQKYVDYRIENRNADTAG